MSTTGQKDEFVTFPDYIVPAAEFPITEMNKRIADIENKLSIKYKALDDEKKTNGDQTRTWHNLRDTINQLEAKKEKIYDHPQWKWAKQFGSALIVYSENCFTTHDERMIQYLDARVDEGEFAHVTEFYKGQNGEALPAILRQVNQVPAVANRLCGEVDTIGFNYTVAVIDTDSINEKLDDHAEKTADAFTRIIRQKAGVEKILGKPVEDADSWQTEEAPDFDKFNFANHKLDEEVMVKRGLDYLMRKTDLAFTHKLSHEAFRKYIATSKMCLEVWDDIEDPNITPVDPRDLFYILSRNSPFIQHGIGAGRYFAATPQEIIQMCPEMPYSDIKRLREIASEYLTGKQGPEWLNKHGGFVVRRSDYLQPFYLHCWRFNFMATKRVRIRLIENKFDLENPYEKYVDDNENDKNAEYVYRYVDELWEGYRFGYDIFYQLRPVPGQHKYGDYVEKKTLNFIGIVDPNPSLGQLMQPIEALRMEVFFAIERLVAQVRGKIMVVDEANESDSADNQYNSMTHAVWKINSAKEGDQQLMGPLGAKKAAMPEVLDLGLSTTIRELYSFIGFLDQNIAQLTGITGPRRGEVKSDTGLGQSEKAQEASSMATQPYFTTFYTIVQMTLEKVIEQMQRTWAGKDITKYFLGRDGAELLRLIGDKWPLPKYGLFLENAANDQVIKGQIYKLAETLMPIQNEPDLALALIKIINSNGAKEAERIFEKGIEALKKSKASEAKSEKEKMAQEEKMAQMEEQNKYMRDKLKAIDGPVAVEQLRGKFGLEKEEMKLDHKKNTQQVSKTDKIDLMVAANELDKDKREHEQKLEPEPAAK